MTSAYAYNAVGAPLTVIRYGVHALVTFSDKSRVNYSYNVAGEVQTVTTYAMVEGSKRPVKMSQRSGHLGQDRPDGAGDSSYKVKNK
ncbi:MAG: hypothetical protein K2K84_00560 [Muribaculaceae bacterium]|nr:hypothetical protein [Muribaculaceae bacterium]